LADPISGQTVPTRAAALRLARTMGCQGAHRQGDGWMPCESHRALMALVRGGVESYRAHHARKRTSFVDPASTRRRRTFHVRERGPRAIEHIGAGLVSGQ
jgi:hypothetical protein